MGSNFLCLFLYLIWHARLRIVRQYNKDNLFHICVVLIFCFSAHEISVNLKPQYFFLSTHWTLHQAPNVCLSSWRYLLVSARQEIQTQSVCLYSWRYSPVHLSVHAKKGAQVLCACLYTWRYPTAYCSVYAEQDIQDPSVHLWPFKNIHLPTYLSVCTRKVTQAPSVTCTFKGIHLLVFLHTLQKTTKAPSACLYL